MQSEEVIIYKRIEYLEYKIKESGFRSASMNVYAEELKKKAEKVFNDRK